MDHGITKCLCFIHILCVSWSNFRGCLHMDHEVIPRPCKICNWMLNPSRDHFNLHQGKNVRVIMEFKVPKGHFLRPTIFTDMVQQILRLGRQKSDCSITCTRGLCNCIFSWWIPNVKWAGLLILLLFFPLVIIFPYNSKVVINSPNDIPTSILNMGLQSSNDVPLQWRVVELFFYIHILSEYSFIETKLSKCHILFKEKHWVDLVEQRVTAIQVYLMAILQYKFHGEETMHINVGNSKSVLDHISFSL